MAFNLINTLRGVQNTLKNSYANPVYGFKQSQKVGTQLGTQLKTTGALKGLGTKALGGALNTVGSSINPVLTAGVKALSKTKPLATIKSLSGTPTSTPATNDRVSEASVGRTPLSTSSGTPTANTGISGGTSSSAAPSTYTAPVVPESTGTSDFSTALMPSSDATASSASSTTGSSAPSGNSTIDALRAKITGLAAPSTEEQQLQDQLAQIKGADIEAVNALEGQGRGIPVNLVRGQQAILQRQNATKEQTLLDRIASMSAQRQAQLQAAQQDYTMAAAEQERQDRLTAPTTVGGNILRFNPATGQYDTLYSAPAEAQDYPAAVQEYQFAQQNGYEGSFLDYQSAKNAATAEGKAPTAAQSQAAVYANRLSQAEQTLSTNSFYRDIRYGTPMAEILKSEDRKLAEQAEQNFINAVLRRESGAAISPSEYANARSQYIPQPGDTQAVLDQKAQNRAIVQQGLQNEAAQAAFTPTSGTGDSIDKFLDSFSSGPSTPIKGSKATGTQAAQVLSQNYKSGSYGGQCGRFVNRITGFKMGNSYESKMAYVDPKIGKSVPVQPGDVFVMPYKDYGHTGFVANGQWIKKSDGSYDIPVIDSNWNNTSNPERVSVHYINSKKMSGFARAPVTTQKVSFA